MTLNVQLGNMLTCLACFAHKCESEFDISGAATCHVPSPYRDGKIYTAVDQGAVTHTPRQMARLGRVEHRVANYMESDTNDTYLTPSA